MGLELKQSLRLSQQLVMTPQLQQAIKLLQLSRLELVDVIRSEIAEPHARTAPTTARTRSPSHAGPAEEQAAESVPAQGGREVGGGQGRP